MPGADPTPLAGRRLYFVGIGGAGLSAYANIARAWGAEVRGWDVRETIFIETLGGDRDRPRRRSIAAAGWEIVVSTAHAGRFEGTPRAEFLAELVAPRPAIVVGGAHGKTTTAAMIAYVLRETGRDPAWIIGGVVPQLGGNAGTGAGWLVVEGDESDRSIGRLRPQIAVLTNIELDHHATLRVGEPSCARSSTTGPRGCRRSCAAGSSSRSPSTLLSRVITTGRTPPPPWRRSSSPVSPATEAEPALARSPGSSAGSSSSARGGASPSTTTTGTTRPSSSSRCARHASRTRQAPDRGLPAARVRAHPAARAASSAERSGLRMPRSSRT